MFTMKLFCPQNGYTNLGTVAAACGDSVVSGLLSALVIWTEPRREKGTGQPFRHPGQCKLLSISWLLT